MQLISKFKKGFKFLFCVIDISVNRRGLFLYKDKKSITIINAFQKVLNDSKRKPNKIWEDKGNEFYNRSMKSWPEKYNKEIQHIMKENLFL